MGTAVMVTSGKGGTGKSSLTAAVASCLAALGQRVLCIDLDLGLRSLDLLLGMDDRVVMDFTDVADGRCSLADAAVEQPDIRGLFLLTAPMGLEGVEQTRFCAVVEDAKEQFDFVFLDSPAGLGKGFGLAMSAADRAIIVSASDPTALRDAQRVVSELMEAVPQLHLVMNRVEPKLIRRLHFTIDFAMDSVGLPLLGVVPEDQQVKLAAGQGRPLALCAYKGAVCACLNIAKRLLGIRAPLGRL